MTDDGAGAPAKRHVHGGKSSEGVFEAERLLTDARLRPGDSVVDAGCGNGWLALAAARAVGPSGSVLAVDSDEASAAEAGRRAAGTPSLRVVHGDATRGLPMADASVDVFLMVKTLHGFVLNGEADSLFSEMGRVLRQGGKAVVVEKRKADDGRGPPPSERISEEELDALMAERGYRRLWAVDAGSGHYLAVYSTGPLGNAISAGEPGSTVADIGNVVARVSGSLSSLPASLLIRHSAREPILHTSHTFEARLTDEGRAFARKMGAALPQGAKIVLYHSPVHRCAETARLIASGFSEAGGEATVAGERDYLACSYLKKDAEVFAHFDHVGHPQFIAEWFGGRLPADWIDPPSLAAPRLLSAMLSEEVANPGAVHIHVSHDWNVLLLRGLADDIAAKGAPWPGFLSGVLVHRRNGTTFIDWGEGNREVDGEMLQ